MRASAFSRVRVFVAALAAAMSMADSAARKEAVAKLGEYRSRGKGQGKIGRTYGRNRNRFGVGNEAPESMQHGLLGRGIAAVGRAHVKRVRKAEKLERDAFASRDGYHPVMRAAKANGFYEGSVPAGNHEYSSPMSWR